MSTAVDMADSITGIVTRPVGEYQDEKSRQARAEALETVVETRQEKLLEDNDNKGSTMSGR